MFQNFISRSMGQHNRLVQCFECASCQKGLRKIFVRRGYLRIGIRISILYNQVTYFNRIKTVHKFKK